MNRWMDSNAPAGWVFQWLSSLWRVQIDRPVHWDLFTLIQCFSHGYMGRNDSQTKTHKRKKKIQTKATTCWARRCRTSPSVGRFSLSAAVGWCTQSVLTIHTRWKQSPQVRRGTQRGNSTRKEQQAMDGESKCGGSVFSVLCQWALKAQTSSGVPPGWGLAPSGTAGAVYDQRDVDAVHLQQVDQEGAITLGIQPHGPHMVSGECGIDAPCYLRQGLEDAVIQLHEEPAAGTQTWLEVSPY